MQPGKHRSDSLVQSRFEVENPRLRLMQVLARSARLGHRRAMIARVRTAPWLRHMALALIGAALLVRALVPQGWMPVRNTHGGVSLAWCSGSAPVAMRAMAGMRHEGRHDDGHGGGHPCAFAAASLALDAPALPTLHWPKPQFDAVSTDRARSVSVGRGLAAPPPPSTGPPVPA